MIINYRYYHWGPFLYQSHMSKIEVNNIKKLCKKDIKKDATKLLAGLIDHEYLIDSNKLIKIMSPYFKSYLESYIKWSGGKTLGNQIQLRNSWVNYMTKYENNPIHTHDGDLSFVIFLKVPKELNNEFKKHKNDRKRPGVLKFLMTLNECKNFIAQQSFFPKVGDVFIFPAHLHHEVNSFKCKGERISVSGNLKINDVKNIK